MKKYVLAMSLLAVCKPATSIELTDYKLTDSGYDQAEIQFNATSYSGNQYRTSYSAMLAADYEKIVGTKEKVWSVSAAGDSGVSRGGGELDEKFDQYRFNVSAYADMYFKQAHDKLFYFGAADYDHQNNLPDKDISVFGGLGYGRVWNATSLAKALRIQEALMTPGLLTAEMKDQDLLSLASIISLESEYRAEHGKRDYKSIWYAAMDDVLSNSGLLSTARLTTFATVKLDEVLEDENIYPRRHGWVVRFGAGVQAADFSGLSDNDVKLIVQTEYAKPVGLSGQWINKLSYYPSFADTTIHKIQNRLSYTHEISNRIDWSNAWELSATEVDDEANNRIIYNRLSSSFTFEVANELDLLISLVADDQIIRPRIDDSFSDDGISTSFNTALVYRLK